ncbi:hypothetical protein [Burkholderia cenocepacia]|uniref:hypothetical protein n=1 Tax=Burkholderia cenocepacia TaxID=95486 RepID=UPI002ABD8449|nr:hypothetical protein [Burkholderia cenocepacia]
MKRENEILRLKKAIDAKHDEFLQALRDRDRAQQVADSGAGDTGAIAALQRQRSEMLGKAYLAGETADTGQIDREIERLEAALREARKTQEGAAAAAALLEAKATTLLQEEGALRQQQAALARDWFQERFDEAKKRYVEKVYEVIRALETFHALERSLTYFNGSQVPPLTLTNQLLIGLRDRGLVLPPGVEKVRFVNYPNDLHVPYCLDAERAHEFAAAEVEALSQELRSYGFE